MGTVRRMHMTLTDSVADGTGAAQLDIWPRLREAPADNATVITAGCAGTFALASNVTSWSVNEMAHYGFTFAFSEDI